MRKLIQSIGQFIFGSTGKTDPQRPMFEPLESRQFLSASPIAPLDCACASQHAIAAAAATDFHLTDIIGKWKGTIQTNLRPRPYKATINITGITPAGKLQGIVSVPLLLTNYKFAINTRKSNVNPDGTFNAKFSKFGISGQLSGHYDDVTKHIVGDFTASAPGKNITGTFDFKRIS